MKAKLWEVSFEGSSYSIVVNASNVESAIRKAPITAEKMKEKGEVADIRYNTSKITKVSLLATED